MKKHIIDDLDIFIFMEIYNSVNSEEPVTNWQIAQKYARNVCNKIDKDIDSKYYRLIKTRLEVYSKMGLFHKSVEDGKAVYEMDLDKVNFMKCKFPSGTASAIVFRINEKTQSL